MKKLFITLFTLFSFVIILLLPAMLGFHASIMSHHNMSASDCIEHCIDLKAYSHTPKIISTSLFLEVVITKFLFSKIFEFVIPLFLIYILLFHAPPNLNKNIKNYDYSSLLGIIKLTT